MDLSRPDLGHAQEIGRECECMNAIGHNMWNFPSTDHS